MKKLGRLMLFGFLSWLVIFSASVCLFRLKRNNEHLFEMFMGTALTTCTVGLTLLYFRKVRADFFREGVLLGIAFIGCNLLFDLPIFCVGMRMSFEVYLMQIGLAYLSMGVFSIGFGFGLQRFCRITEAK